MTIETVLGLGRVVSVDPDRRQEADSLFTRAWRLSRRVHGEDHLTTLDAMSMRAENFLNEGSHPDEALVLLSAACEQFGRVWGESHHATIDLRTRRATARMIVGELDAAEAELRELITLSEAALGTDHSLYRWLHGSLGTLLLRRQDWAAADSVLARSIELTRIHDPDRGEMLGFTLRGRGNACWELGRREQAVALWHEAVALLSGVYGEAGWYTQDATRSLARRLWQDGQAEVAESLLRRSRQVLLAERGAADTSTQATVFLLEDMWRDQGRHGEVATLLQAYERAVAAAETPAPAILLAVREHLRAGSAE